ncbi:hypothetical protein [Streptomyces sp. CB03234]|uniref:hypothetical protein n=1 Tax=Streptomyces sp. (strain CB03234) TaxID=1703937 RepID=UPI00117D9DA5|nr:hypothetical protein [Streptomyces sp. CB03234]
MHHSSFVNFARTLPSDERSFCVGTPGRQAGSQPRTLPSRFSRVDRRPFARFYASCIFEPFPARHKALMERGDHRRTLSVENTFHVTA